MAQLRSVAGRAAVDAPEPRCNLLLAGLPSTAYDRLLPELELVKLGQGQVLYDPGEPIRHVHFPLNALASLLMLTSEGQAVEVAAVGRDGMVGMPVSLGLESDSNQALVQVAGYAVRMTAPALRAALDREAALRDMLQRFAQVLFVHMGQSAVCNRLHPLNERCARWLLEAHDRVGQDIFPLTQEFLAGMLGVRRATVTIAAGMLQQAGLIRYHRGIVTVLDRERLEDASCECYGVVATTTERLLGPLPLSTLANGDR